MGTVDHKVAIITGASQGIGAGLVDAYRRRNYAVVANSRTIAASDDAGVLTIAGDIADPETAEHIVVEAVGRFGRVDTLINNAGVFIAKLQQTSKTAVSSNFYCSGAFPAGDSSRLVLERSRFAASRAALRSALPAEFPTVAADAAGACLTFTAVAATHQPKCTPCARGSSEE